ncbi:MAG: patatin-like phospholipase family protein [Candidatus Omnitrophica bacterium]|nr:patatin-like phospholipase family protein [Candidatus Omnitrophota bacterium]
MTALPSFFNNKIPILKQIPIFQGLNWFVLNRISRCVEIVDFNKGDIICQQGAPADAFYALVSGRVYSYSLNPSGHKEDVDFILRGMQFGIVSTLTGENHSRTYEAINDSVVIKINKDSFSQLLKSIPQLAVALSQSLSQRIRKQVTHTKNTQESTIIAVYAPVQGAGASTYATNLALGLKEQTDKRILLFSLSSDMSEDRMDLTHIAGDHHSILNTIIKGALSVDLLSAKFDQQNTTLMSNISQFVSALVNDYNYIVLDLPNEMDDVVMKTLTQADVVHLVSVDNERDLDTTRQVIDKISEQLKERFDAERVQVIISGVKTENRFSPEEIKKILNYDVFLFLPYLQASEFTCKKIIPGFTFVEVEAKSEYAQTIRRLSRQISNVMIGLVLGGGAALGITHIGVIRVLEREGIPIDIVVGSSMGALIGSIWSLGHTADDMEEYGREFENIMGLLNIYDPIVPIAGFVGGEGIRQWLKGKLENKTFHDSKIPIRIVVYDLFHRKEIVVSDGSLVDAVCKSIAIPGVIRPIMEGKQMIIDGGVLNPLPTNVLTQMGVKKIIAVNVLQSPEEVDWSQKKEDENLIKFFDLPFSKHPFKYIGFRLHRIFSKIFTPNIADIIVRTLQATEFVIAEQSAKQADVLIHPDLRGIQWYELNKVNELIKRGEEAAHKALPAIKALVDR